MKTHITLLLCCICCWLSFGQSITEIEYFYNTDPGFGNATAITPNANTGNLTQSVSIPVPTDATGFNTLYFRTKDDTNTWSLYDNVIFFITDNNIATTATNISTAEYFINTDPGFGNATALTISANTGLVTESFAIPIGTDLSGFNTLYIRTQDDLGVWSLYDNVKFFITEIQGNGATNITAIEYFIDTDPGFGNATSVSVNTNTGSVTQNLAIPLGTLDEGFHNLYLRTQDDLGEWSLYDKRLFFVTPPQEVSPIVAAEYFYDTDPGFGNGTAVTLVPTGNLDEFTVDLSTVDITCDFHDFYIRLINEDGTWSLYDLGLQVEVFDNADPTIVVFDDITVELDANGEASLTIADVDNGTFDDCELVSVVLNQTQFDYSCDNLGENTVTVTATDAEDKVSTLDVTVNVIDTINPVAIAQDITVQLDANGTATITGNDLDGGSTDNCEVTNFSVDITSFDCDSIGANDVILTVEDASGNTNSAAAIVTVVEAVAPTVLTQDITVQLDAEGNATIGVDHIDNGSSDNCGIDARSIDITDFDCSNLGENTVTLTVTDLSGNSSSETAIVTVEDTEAPIVITQDITVQLDANGEASISASDIDNGSTDNCSIASLSLDVSSFNCDTAGENTVTLTATDSSGNSNAATAIVSVLENEAPIALAQDITIQLDANGSAELTPDMIDNGSTDNCGIVSSSVDLSEFNCDDIGENTVTLTVEDGSGNSSSVTAIVTVEAGLPPDVVTQDITVELDANGTASITVDDIDGGSTGNCSIASSSLDITSFTCDDIGPNTVTLTVVDGSGNSTSETATVTVVDNEIPTVITQDITIQLGANGEAIIIASDINNGSFDNCAITSLSADQTQFDCNSTGSNTVILTAVDASGNSNSATAIVTVLENENPIAIAQNITVELDTNGSLTISGSDLDNGSSDNCSITSTTLDITTFDCSNLGENTVTFTVEDASGNSDSTTAIVTVVDNLAPSVIAQDIAIQLDSNGLATITTADIDNGSSDNCSIASLNLDITEFDCSTIGDNTVTLTAIDANGNSSSAEALVTVFENENPVAIAQDITVELDESGTVTISADDINNGSTDNCGIASIAIDISSFDCSTLGPNTITFTVTDVSGNIDSVTAVVTVEDNLDPVAVAQDITISLDSNGSASITADDVDNGSVVNCGTASKTIDISSFNCSNVGANTVTLTITNSAGNSVSTTAVVTVVDNEVPIVLTQDITVQLNANGEANITTDDIDAGSTDNCSIASISLDTTVFNCDTTGDNTVSLVVVDASGNSNSATAIVTVLENENPIAVAQNITVQLDESGIATISASDLDNGSSDNCGITNRSIDITNFGCSDLGENTVTLTVEDASGNSNNTTAIVTVEDAIAPTVIVQNFTVALDASGAASITLDDIDNGSTDNCTVDSRSLDLTSFDCSNLGSNTVTLSVTDNSGNTGTATATVTVVDSVNPVAVAQNINVQLDTNGLATIAATDLDNGSSDNCGINTRSLDISSFDCSNLGANTVTLTVEDAGGNSNSTTAVVTVVDNIDPLAIGQDITIDISGSTSVSISAEDVNNGSSDNCGTVSLSIDVDTFTSPGEFPVVLTVTDEDGNLVNVTVTVTVIDSTLSVDVNTANDFSITIHPNPVKSVLYFETESNITDFSIIDITGKTVLKQQNTQNEINVDRLSHGVYFIRFNLDAGQTVVKRFVKN